MSALLLTALFAAGQDRPAQPPGGGDRPAMANSIDGNWTVICAEKNGQPVAEAKDCTVRVRDNVITFTPKDAAADKNKMKALKVSFGQNGTIRVMEANADGKFENTGTGGTGTTPPAGGGDRGGKSGIYVLTQDYLAVCLHDEAAGTGGRPDAPPAGGAAGGDAGKPSGKSYMTVILKRADGDTRPGDTPKRDKE